MHAKSLTRPTRWRRRQRRLESAISRTRSKTGHPDTCCRSIRLMIPYAKLATWQKVGQSARCRPWGRSEAARGERKGGRLWAFFPHFVGPLLDSTCSPKYRLEEDRIEGGGGDDYARLFNTKGSKTNTEIRRAAARPVIDNVPDRALPS